MNDTEKNFDWIRRNANNVKYRGEWVALVDGRCLVHGRKLKHVLRTVQANAIYPLIHFCADPDHRDL